MAKDVLALDEAEAKEDEWQLELECVLPDFHGRPEWSVYAQVEGEWLELIEKNMEAERRGECVLRTHCSRFREVQECTDGDKGRV